MFRRLLPRPHPVSLFRVRVRPQQCYHSSRANGPTESGRTFVFHEEPLGLPMNIAYGGFFQGVPGDKLGPSGRYVISAKLGVGVGSSVWLAKDQMYIPWLHSFLRHAQIITGKAPMSLSKSLPDMLRNSTKKKSCGSSTFCCASPPYHPRRKCPTARGYSTISITKALRTTATISVWHSSSNRPR